MLKDRPVRVIVRRVPVDESVEHDGVERHPPVLRRGEKRMVSPHTGIVERIGGVDGSIEVPLDIFGIVSK